MLIRVYEGGSTQGGLFFACTCGPGASPWNELWAERKRASVAFFKTSTAALHVKYPEGLPSKYGISENAYASHGGGSVLCFSGGAGHGRWLTMWGRRRCRFPLRVRGVEPLVGIVVVSGLSQVDDHGVICEALEEMVQAARAGGGP